MGPILHGVPLSQPFRAVAWAMLQKKLPFTVKVAVPGSTGKGGTRAPEYLAMAPAGTVPVLQDGALAISESPAILEYLASKHGWTDLYPTDPAERAKISAIMHWHHSGTRELSIYLAEKVRPDLVQLLGESGVALKKSKALDALGLVENHLLGGSTFLAGRSEPSIADLLVYEEVGQLSPKFANLLDLTPYPNVCAWSSRMEALPAFEAAHASLAEIGDLSSGPVSPKALGGATKAGLKALAAAQSESKL